MRKVYVKVTCEYDVQGQILPLSIHWEDGTVYAIDRVQGFCPSAATKVGGFGFRYQVRISNHEQGVQNLVRYLYHERGLSPDRWFVEGKD